MEENKERGIITHTDLPDSGISGALERALIEGGRHHGKVAIIGAPGKIGKSTYSQILGAMAARKAIEEGKTVILTTDMAAMIEYMYEVENKNRVLPELPKPPVIQQIEDFTQKNRAERRAEERRIQKQFKRFKR